ncbi:laccase [Roridomyces roridus]|uniref:Laccase n=1 Tax=Roridomyces roridus TaxID=1738132 RepID=A0AAD7C0S4_9AGAR|nr:laccase [Roridomyces roridus]
MWSRPILTLSAASSAQRRLHGAHTSHLTHRSSHLPIVNKHIAPDGYRRSTVLAGGTFPGPLIQGSKGERFEINVEDRLTDRTMETATSIHWHGIFQKGTNYEDGVAMVTQCPIVPGESFKYDFQTFEQTGTYWYHSHLATQYCDGLRGPLVIYDPHDPARHLYDIDDESTVITLADWYHYPAPQQNPGKAALANSTLINGLGRYKNGPLSELAVVSVHPGKRYRFRLVSIACDPNFMFSIDGHNLTIIEVDGVNHQPLVVDQIQIYAAQRYSFILHADRPTSNYWIRAPPNSTALNTGFVNATNSAILHYVGASHEEPVTNSTISNPLVETGLHPLVPMPVPGVAGRGKADVNLQLTINLNTTASQWMLVGQTCVGSNCSSTPLAALDNTTYTAPPTPVLLQILNGAHTPQELLPRTNIVELKRNKTVEVSFVGGSIGAPVVRDVVNTGSAGDLPTIRFVTDNDGPWFLHCHIDWHLQAGLALVFAEDIPTIAQEKPPVAWEELCPKFNASMLNAA